VLMFNWRVCVRSCCSIVGATGICACVIFVLSFCILSRLNGAVDSVMLFRSWWK